MSSMGIKIDQFDTPICNSFHAKVLNDQLCYEINLNEHSNKDNNKQEIKSGFVFIMDYNEDRQVTFEDQAYEENSYSLIDRMVNSDENDYAVIYLNTFGKS